jgi:16S rRNA (cytosine967-C5)-methyltransferase
MRLAYGATQRKGTLDYLIEKLAGRSTERLDGPVLAALRLGLYELLYLDGAPDRAVVADAVELSKTSRNTAHRLVNAVLRRVTREGSRALLGGLGDKTPERAAVAHSYPEWIARLWWSELGAEEARALMAAGNEPGELAVRVNTLRSDAAKVSRALGSTPSHSDVELPEALVLDGPFDLHGSQAWKSGDIYAQSRAAMLVARVLDPRPGERVLDLCAAPGGKSTHIAALMKGEGEVHAVERNPARAREIGETVKRMGASSVRVEVADASAPRTDGNFDRVLVDPPCSGLGTLQAHADLRWRMTPERVTRMSSVQAAILDAGASAVRPEGVLVYSTCTINAAENERQTEQFLKRNPSFVLDDLASAYPAYAHPVMSEALMTLPSRDRTAGFFIARMRRSAEPSAGRL